MPLKITVAIPVKTSEGVENVTNVFVVPNFRMVNRRIGAILQAYKSQAAFNAGASPVEPLTFNNQDFPFQDSAELTVAQYNAPVDLLTAVHNQADVRLEIYAGSGNVTIVGF